MKKTLLFVFLNLNLFLFSQESKLSIELNYPIPVDNNFIGKNYNGIVDIGAKYKIIDKNILDFGVAFNTGLLVFNNSKDSFTQNFKVYAYPIQPKIYCEFNIKNVEKLHPYTSLGYSFIVFKATGTNNGYDISNFNDTQSGLNLNLGLSYDITNRFFVNGQFDFIKLQKENGIPNSTYNTSVNLIKFGIGLRI
ncbi:outer membrane beta-barrel protein [Flavobacterium sp. TP390]|uniref:Outer membrane beta-barrel protein n=1 Tax=Flavobacterium profundi TaxID=1774945 RepID=A0A6I4IFF1_9FLAO|nr:outer membrane beta-barrel protein [Flavobacterium profundi]MVO08375.1 outer membrane beta-barrel protein [Flavobacterium profundi]